jgi:hypothetical protein
MFVWPRNEFQVVGSNSPLPRSRALNSEIRYVVNLNKCVYLWSNARYLKLQDQNWKIFLIKASFVSIGLARNEAQSTRIKTAWNKNRPTENCRSVKIGLESNSAYSEHCVWYKARFTSWSLDIRNQTTWISLVLLLDPFLLRFRS